MAAWILPSREDIEKRVDKSGPDFKGLGPCWLWKLALTKDGYGHYRCGIPLKSSAAHRVAYWVFIGPTPHGKQLDHLCRNRACCNPAHLEPVTSKENARRGLNGELKTHCKNGHEMTPENTYYFNNPDNPNKRLCRECHRRWQREWKARQRAKGRVFTRKRAVA